MLDNFLRETKDFLLAPLARCLFPIHPITITIIALLCGLLAGLFLILQEYSWGLFFWILNRILDGLDGTVARVCAKKTDFGGYLDIVFDFVVYALIPISLVIGHPSAAGFVSLAFLLASFYINAASWMYLSAILEKQQHGAAAQGELTTVTMPAGLIGGTETIIFYCAFIIWPHTVVPLFILMGVLVLVTVCQRLLWARHHLV